jgi:hypothetical protein
MALRRTEQLRELAQGAVFRQRKVILNLCVWGEPQQTQGQANAVSSRVKSCHVD